MRKALPGESPEDRLDATAPSSARLPSPVGTVAAVPAVPAAAAATVRIQGSIDHNAVNSAPRYRRPRPQYCVCQVSAAGGEGHTSGYPASAGGGLSTREIPQDAAETLGAGGAPSNRLHDQQTTCAGCEGLLKGHNNNGLSVAQQESNSGISGRRETWSLRRAVDAGMAAWGRREWLAVLRRRPRVTGTSG